MVAGNSNHGTQVALNLDANLELASFQLRQYLYRFSINPTDTHTLIVRYGETGSTIPVYISVYADRIIATVDEFAYNIKNDLSVLVEKIQNKLGFFE